MDGRFRKCSCYIYTIEIKNLNYRILRLGTSTLKVWPTNYGKQICVKMSLYVEVAKIPGNAAGIMPASDKREFAGIMNVKSWWPNAPNALDYQISRVKAQNGGQCSG